MLEQNKTSTNTYVIFKQRKKWDFVRASHKQSIAKLLPFLVS